MNPKSTHPRIGIIGLGLMGTAFAERFLDAGWQVRVWNRSRDKAARLLDRGAVWSEHPLAECDRVLVSLYTSDVVRQVLAAMRSDWRAGVLIVDTTTGEPDQTVALGQTMADAGMTYLDAPVSGSSHQTRRGEATVMVGGPADAYARCADLWPMLGARIIHCGPLGSASKMKLITNLVLGLNRAALAEGLAFAEAIGVQAAAALEVMAASMAYSRVMDVKGRKMIERDFSLQARLSQHLKDVRVILQTAAAAGLQLPISETHCRLLEHASMQGLGDLDNSAIIEAIRRHRAS